MKHQKETLRPRSPAARAAGWVWTAAALTALGAATGILCLFLSYGAYPYQFFLGYFEDKRLLLLNLFPSIYLTLLLYCLLRRAWAAWLTASVITLIPAVVNYFKLMFRDEVFTLSDVAYIREGLNISGRYAVTMDWKLWLILVGCVLGTAGLALLVRARPRGRGRAAALLLLLTLIVPMMYTYIDVSLYAEVTNSAQENEYNTTEYRVARGFWYSFLYSSRELFWGRPEGYTDAAAEEILAGYTDGDIPEEKKADVIVIQLEAFCDLTTLGIEGISDEVYAAYRDLAEESYTGVMTDSTFAAGTILTERSFLTGTYYSEKVTHNRDSLARYFSEQGYFTQFTHGGNIWFYDRSAVCERLGFDQALFSENYFAEAVGTEIAYDQDYFPEILKLYEEAKDAGQSYFGFHITYQGHAPYGTSWLAYGDGWYTGEASEESWYILNNYLGSVYDTQVCLSELVEALRQREDPVILVLYGDHKPWLGDGNSVYNELGINLDLSTEEGFHNYYDTQYLIWGNEAARALFGDLSGEGPGISPMYLSTLLFDCCGWEGPAVMGLNRDLISRVPIISSAGYSIETGVPFGEHTEAGLALVEKEKYVSYYCTRNFVTRDSE